MCVGSSCVTGCLVRCLDGVVVWSFGEMDAEFCACEAQSAALRTRQAVIVTEFEEAGVGGGGGVSFDGGVSVGPV